MGLLIKVIKRSLTGKQGLKLTHFHLFHWCFYASPLLPLKTKGSNLLLYLVHFILGSCSNFQGLVHCLSSSGFLASTHHSCVVCRNVWFHQTSFIPVLHPLYHLCSSTKSHLLHCTCILFYMYVNSTCILFYVCTFKKYIILYEFQFLWTSGEACIHTVSCVMKWLLAVPAVVFNVLICNLQFHFFICFSLG